MVILFTQKEGKDLGLKDDDFSLEQVEFEVFMGHVNADVWLTGEIWVEI